MLSFVPESPLEAPLQGLLNAELGQLIVTFTGNDYTAAGPAIHITGRIRLHTAANDLVSASLIDATGVAYRLSGRFDGTTLFRFHSYDSPWRGDGTLERLAN